MSSKSPNTIKQHDLAVDTAIHSHLAAFEPKEEEHWKLESSRSMISDSPKNPQVWNVDARDEHMKKELEKIHNFDVAIQKLNREMKSEIEKTRCFQYENRKKLENVLLRTGSESRRLTENTKQFFQLCPDYTSFSTNKIAETNNKI